MPTLAEQAAYDAEAVWFNPRDFGAVATVTPLDGGDAWELPGLLEPRAQEARLGPQAAGTLGEPVYWCLPELAALLAEGDQLTLATGETYAVVEVVVVPGAPARVWLVER